MEIQLVYGRAWMRAQPFCLDNLSCLFNGVEALSYPGFCLSESLVSVMLQDSSIYLLLYTITYTFT